MDKLTSKVVAFQPHRAHHVAFASHRKTSVGSRDTQADTLVRGHRQGSWGNQRFDMGCGEALDPLGPGVEEAWAPEKWLGMDYGLVMGVEIVTGEPSIASIHQ